MMHFVGFTGEEYVRACRVFGRPDFVHRFNDDRFKFGGEFAPGDVAVFANGEENKVRRWTYNDSAEF